MSLSKFAQFIERNYQWGSINLQSRKVVIKGDALCYHLYCSNHRWQDGGHYHEFYHTVRKFFVTLSSQRTTAYVVMNGANTDKEKYKKRCIQRLYRISNISTAQQSSVRFSVLPLLAKTVFMDAMRDYDIRFVVADGDGDPDCVALANHLECPVLADDADFYIFNIRKGYVPLFDPSRSVINFSAAVRCYNFNDFDAQFNFLSSDQRLYIPFLLRIDPLPENVSNYVAFGRISSHLETIRQSSPFFGYKGSEISYRKEMSVIREFYRVLPTSFEALEQVTSLTLLNQRIPQWIYGAYKRGDFDQHMMYVLISGGMWRYACVIEDTKNCSACAVADKPRKFLLGALSTLLNDSRDIRVTQRSANPFDLIVTQAHLKKKHLPILPEQLENISSLFAETRQRMFIRSFNCKHIQLSINRIPLNFRMVVIASRAWLRTGRKRLEKLLIPLVFCVLSCSGHYPMPPCNPSNPSYDIDLLHSFAQWQCLLHLAIALNQLLACPFQYTSPAQLFSCSVVEYYCSNPPPQPFKELPSIMIDVISKS